MLEILCEKRLKSNIYQFAWDYMEGNITETEAKRQFILDDWHLAKRQITWFSRQVDSVQINLDAEDALQIVSAMSH